MRNFRYKWMEMNPLNIEMLKILKSSEGFLSEKFLPFEKKIVTEIKFVSVFILRFLKSISL